MWLAALLHILIYLVPLILWLFLGKELINNFCKDEVPLQYVGSCSALYTVILWYMVAMGPVRFGFFAFKPNRTIYIKQKPNQVVYELSSHLNETI